MIELAETLRIDERRTDNPRIFMAREKPFLGFTLSTQNYCRIFLSMLILAFLIPATIFLKLSITRR